MPFVRLVGGAPQTFPPRPVKAERPVKEVTPSMEVTPISPEGKGSGGGGAVEEAYEKAGPKPPRKQRRPALRLDQIMSDDVVTLRADDPLSRAREVIRDRRFRHLPVVAGEGTVVGILSDRDVLKADDNDPDRPVREIMSHELLTATPDTEIRDAAAVMVTERIGALPVLDPSHRLVGIVTTTDILRTVVHRAPLDLWI